MIQYTKAKIFNLACGDLLLQRQIIDPESDKSNEAKVLLTWWDVAFWGTLADLDLDSTSTAQTLELLATNPSDYPNWQYVYKYPYNCAFFRKIKSTVEFDTRYTHVPKHVAMRKDIKCIFTNQQSAIAEIITSTFPLASLSAPAGLAIAHSLAMHAAPLITGKGAARLLKDIEAKYAIAKANAQGMDQNENFVFRSEAELSEFVAARYE